MTINFLKNVLFGMILALTVIATANAYSQTLSNKKLKYPLVAIPDSGTGLNKQRAEMIMKIADFTINHNQVDIGYNPADDEGKPYQVFKTKFTLDSVDCDFMVSNPQTEEYKYGFMSIYLKSKSEKGTETDIMLIDDGFDGVFNFGVRTVGKYNAIGQKILDYNQSLLFQNNAEKKDGFENATFFQTIGDKTLDNIISYIGNK